MPICDTCGNEYDKAFTVQWNGRTATFDSIECAAAQIAPECAHCGCRILGHGVETEDAIYCCAHCARKVGNADINDRFPHRREGRFSYCHENVARHQRPTA